MKIAVLWAPFANTAMFIEISGITLHAVGQILSFLFRDVDPSRIEKKPENELEGESEEAKAEETEE